MARSANIVQWVSLVLLGLLLCASIAIIIIGAVTLNRQNHHNNELHITNDAAAAASPSQPLSAFPIKRQNDGSNLRCHPPRVPLCRATNPLDYDYVVVGAGAGGSVVAARLAQADYKVLLVEAGDSLNELLAVTYLGLPLVDTPFLFPWTEGYGPTDTPFSVWNLTTIPQVHANNDVWQYPRGTGIGGSTNHHAMVHMRIGKGDADRWAEAVGDDRWNYQSLLPYLKKMENDTTLDKNPVYHGTTGWLQLRKPFYEQAQTAFMQAAHDVGVPPLSDFNGDPNDVAGVGVFDVQITSKGIRAFAGKDLLWPVYLAAHAPGGKKNLDIWTGTLATKVLIDVTKRAVGIEYLRNTTRKAYAADTFTNRSAVEDALRKPESFGTVRVRREVILAGGSINTPQLLMLSGVGPKQHLQEMGIPVVHDLPAVGNHVKDHIEYAVVHRLNQSYTYMENIGAVIGEYLTTGGGIFGSNGFGVGADWFSDVIPRDYAEPECHIQNGVFYFEGFNYTDWAHTVPQDVPFMTNLIEVSHPEARQGTVRLASRDPTRPPLIDLQLAVSELDLRVMAGCINTTRKIMQAAGLAAYGPVEVRPGNEVDTEAELVEAARGSAFGHHISGATQMGKRCDMNAAVDAELRVYGINGLRVTDASIFPSIVRGNPSGAVYTVAEVVSDMIIQEAKKAPVCA